MAEHIAFIGGGNMANAIISGLLRQGMAAGGIQVVEPVPEVQQRLRTQFGIDVHDQAGASLNRASLVIWAVKPQHFKDAAQPVRAHTQGALHLSVAAGVRSDSIAYWLDNERVVRAMPNTPALIGKGISGLYARPTVSAADRLVVQQAVRTTGDFVWVPAEDHLDAVTAISGSGPAYMFYFMEAMTEAGAIMGLPREQAYELALATCIGAGQLAKSTNEPPELLRQRVTSKGGTTEAALQSMEDSGVKDLFERALFAAQTRARELGNEFGESPETLLSPRE